MAAATGATMAPPAGAAPYTEIKSLEFLCDRPARDKERYECECRADSPCDDSTYVFFSAPLTSPHHATHTLDVQWYGRMALAFRWLVRRLDVGQRMAKWMVD